jgi:hypothetical protein
MLSISSAQTEDCGCATGGAASKSRDTTEARIDAPAVQKLQVRSPAAAAATPADKIWQPLSAIPAARNGLVTYLDLDAYAPFSINSTLLKSTLSKAPMEFTNAARTRPLVMSLPTPAGTLARFAIQDAPVMAPDLAARFPQIKTYRGQGIDDPSATVRLDYTPLGFHAQVLSPNGAFYIDPYWHLDQSTYVSYRRTDANRATDPWMCLTGDPAHDHSGDTMETEPPIANLVNGSELKTYDLAVAATGEYTTFWGGTVTAGLSAIVTAVNRVTGVYEKELAVRLVLVGNNSDIVYTNSATDPYTNDNGFFMLGENQTTIDLEIGPSNYDIGHVFSTGGGGVATLGVVGVNGTKARGVTGLPTPSGDLFYIDYVAHEMGHQFGAAHTFNGVQSSCAGGNRTASSAYEPGSGSTIMAYAGICGSDNLQFSSDPYFHWRSQQQIISYVSGGSGLGAATVTSTGNTPPTVNGGADYTIPARTPFMLTATGSDLDGDGLTYVWEEADLGPAISLSTPDNGTSPLFRSFSPSASPSRTFRKLSELIANISPNNGEQFPLTNRFLNFRVTARDNRAVGGGIADDPVILTVVNTGAPFAVTFPNTSMTLNGGSSIDVSWNVSGTSSGAINLANVKILLSTNGGATFDTVLLASTPNDGSEPVTLPNINTTTARIKVEAVGNVFFDFSNVSFTINQTVTPNGIWTGLGDGTNWTDAANWSNNVVPGLSDDVQINVVANPTIVVSGSQSVRSVSSSEALNITGTLSFAQASVFDAAVALAGTLDGAGAATFNDALSWTGGTMSGTGSTLIASGGGSLSISGSGTKTASRPLQIDGPASLAPGGDKVLVVSNSLSIGAAGTLDLADNAMVVEYSGGSPIATIENYVDGGFALGAWNGVGINSSVAAVTANRSIGIIEATDQFDSFPASFAGALVDGTSVLLRYTLTGDVNLDRTVDITDLGLLATNWQLSPRRWGQGDNNFDQSVDITDLGNLATNWQVSLSARPAPGRLSAPGTVSVTAAVPNRTPFSQQQLDVVTNVLQELLS